MQRLALEDVGMDLCHAVDGMRTDDREVCHAYLSIPEDSGIAQAILPAFALARERLHIAAIDLVDIHVDARKKALEGVDRPLFQGFGKNGMVGVGNALGHDVPGGIPIQALFVHEQAHQLGATHGGVRVVGVDCHELGEAFPVGIGVIELEVADDGRKAGGNEQILLFKAQDATVLARIVGIQNFRDRLGVGAELRGSGVIATVECVKIEVLLCGLGTP